MIFRKYFGQFLILMMLAAQLALAQHATVHFLEDQHIGIAFQQSGDPATPQKHHGPEKGKICQACLLAKDFSHTSLSAAAEIPAVVYPAMFVFTAAQEIPLLSTSFSWEARAPPAFSA
jgi:hypothetical protein